MQIHYAIFYQFVLQNILPHQANSIFAIKMNFFTAKFVYMYFFSYLCTLFCGYACPREKEAEEYV